MSNLRVNISYVSFISLVSQFGLLFLIYNGLLVAIPAAWKKAISNSEQQPVLSSVKAVNIETELAEKHLPLKAIYDRVAFQGNN